MTAPDLARQLVEHPRWTWQPGMCVTALSEDSRTPVHGIYTGDVDVACEDGECPWSVDPTTMRPDINHPATKGWLLHMLREACVCVQINCGRTGYAIHVEWMAHDGRLRNDWFRGAHALAAALLAVWGVA